MKTGAAISFLALGFMLFACGCKNAQTPKPGDEPAVVRRPDPAPFSVVASEQNQRVDGLTTLWARLTLRVSGKLANTDLNKEEAEGHLQIVLPSKVAVTVDKLGNTYFYLGSNDDVYWWLDLSKAKRGYFGRHAQATTETVDRFGIPVHPLDLIELMAITPISPEILAQSPPPQVRWTNDGKLLWYETPARGSMKRVFVDPKTYLPEMVELLDPQGKVVVRSELSKYESFQSRSKPIAHPSVPTRCIFTVPRSEVTIAINLNDPTDKKIHPATFDFKDLATNLYRVNSFVDLDKK